MEIAQYLHDQLDLLRRIACATEEIAKNTCILRQADVKLNGETITQHDTQTVQAGNLAKAAAAPAETSMEEREAKRQAKSEVARSSAAEATSPNASEASATSTGGSDTAGEKGKKLTADDVRTALKAYAYREGNPAAMSLLSAFGASSVSALPEDKWAEFIKTCGGK